MLLFITLVITVLIGSLYAALLSMLTKNGSSCGKPHTRHQTITGRMKPNETTGFKSRQ